MSQDKIRVFVRVRPQSKSEIDNNCKNIIRMKSNAVEIVSSSAGPMKRFTFDNAFWSCNTFLPGNQNENCTQKALYTEVGAPLVEEAFLGFNTAIITYGQTGAGKTYSMYGTDTEDGIIPNLGQSIFLNATQAQKKGWEVVVECSFVQIYNEEIHCLLSPDPKGFNGQMPLRVLEHPKHGYYVLGLTNLVITSANDLHTLVLEAIKYRSTRDKTMNIKTSQSHCILTINIIQTQGSGQTTMSRRSKINLVNLGGSEFADNSNQPTGNSINCSLVTFNRVISYLAEGKKDIPYHDSVLTSILKDSIGVNSKTSILACISPSANQYDRTVSTLQFAEKAKCVSIKAVKNEIILSDTAIELQEEIARLKEKIKAIPLGTKERETATLGLELSESVSSNLLQTMHDRRERSKQLMVEREQNTDALCRLLEEQNGGNIDLRTKNIAKDKKILDILASIKGMNDDSKILKAREEIAALEASDVQSLLEMNENEYDDFNQNAESDLAMTFNANTMTDISAILEDAEDIDDIEMDLDDLEGFDELLDEDIEIDDIDIDDLEDNLSIDQPPEDEEIDIDIDDEDEALCKANTQEPCKVVKGEVKEISVTAEALAWKCVSEVQTSTIKSIVINSHELHNNRYLKEPFRVCKIDENAVLSTRKERIWEIDVFANKFRNLDIKGRESFSLSGSNLYRVEKNTSNNTRLTLHFFEAAHPYVLLFGTIERRQRFYELATLLRRNSVMWCPSFVPQGDAESKVKIVGTTFDRHNGRTIKANGSFEFNVAKMPYEVVDLWYGCFSLADKKVLPQSHVILQSFMPRSVHDVYVIGVTDVPSKFMASTEISNYFVNYLDAKQYFVLASTAASPQDRSKDVNNVFIVICRRSCIVRITHVEAMDIYSYSHSFRKEGLSYNDFSAVGCSFRINECSIACILLNATTRSIDPSARAAAIRGLMANFPSGNNSLDIGVGFDNIIVSGAFGFGEDFTGNDMLIKQMNAGNIMSDMQEARAPSTITGRTNPMRVFYMARPRICRMDVKSYQSSRALDGNNVSANIDIFCQRPFLSTLGSKIKRSKFYFQNFTIIGQRIPSVVNAEIQINADWIEETPLRCALTQNGEIYELSNNKCPGLYLCVCAPDFIRLQHVDFAIFGQLTSSKEKKRINIASGCLSLKNVVTLGESVEFTIPLYYRACTVGTMQGELLHVLQEASSIDCQSAGIGDNTPNVHIFTCYENQILNNNKWTPSTIESGKACEWSLSEFDTEMRREDFQLPDKKKWKWISQWRTDTQDEGWGYGNSIRNAVGKIKKEHKFRRRRWMRAMQADDPMTLHNYLKDL